ncbi:MAG: winged helix-turn-helix transcriptional regulator [Ignavibacteria bacterium]|nr:winged helix-turn-helix transcriptional regulator [Ignavibacteria bacterium]
MDIQKTVHRVRAFNRFYTGVIGVLNGQFLNSSYTLPEARILFEIKHTPSCTSKKIIENMNIDGGYLSRILKKFYQKKLITKTHGKADARVIQVELTAKGRELYEVLTDAQNRLVLGLVNKLTAAKRAKLIKCMSDIEKILNKGE